MEAIAQALSDIFVSSRYADKVIEHYLKKNRKWGSRDRKFFAESVYEVVRWWRFLWWLKGASAPDIKIENARIGDGAQEKMGEGRVGDGARFWDHFPMDQKSLVSLWAHWWVWTKERENSVFSGSQVSPYLTKAEWESLQERLKGREKGKESSSAISSVSSASSTSFSSAPPAVAASVPDWLYERGKSELGEELWIKTLKMLNEPALVYLRVNTLKIKGEELKKLLQQEGIESKLGTELDLHDAASSSKVSNSQAPSPQIKTSAIAATKSSKLGTEHENLGTEQGKLEVKTSKLAAVSETLVLAERKNVFSTQAFKAGFFEVQDWSSQQVAPMLDVAPGMRVVDACAGAGGKTLHLASLMKNKGKILALDIHAWKLKELRTRASRNGVDIIEVKEIEGQKTIKRLESSADRVLLDVPCSGLGVLRRNPDSKWKLSPEEIERLSQLQQEILASYSRMVKVGGKLVYSTCSILPTENERQVQLFLENQKEFALIKQKTFMPQDYNSDGFYMALLERKA